MNSFYRAGIQLSLAAAILCGSVVAQAAPPAKTDVKATPAITAPAVKKPVAAKKPVMKPAAKPAAKPATDKTPAPKAH